MAAQPNLSRLNQRNLESIIQKHTYPINYARPGRLILFNNQHFKSVKNYRAGSEIDVENIRNTFQKFNFEIDVHLDKSGVETLQLIRKYAQQHDFTNDSCVIFFIMSHGHENGKILASDESEVNLNDLIQPFKHVKTLAQKPKLFFVQACRGQNDMKLIGDHDDELQRDTISKANHDDDANSKVPVEADFLFCYSTVDGYYSFR
jgi:hypothetical protein